jgi:23S rRNA A1618 N6-methylase RlmF
VRPNTRPDIDEKNIKSARENVTRNKLKSRVRIVKTKADDPLIPLKAIGVERYVKRSKANLIHERSDRVLYLSIDFVMCNPPFYSSKEEMLASAKEKSRPPFSVCFPNPHVSSSLSLPHHLAKSVPNSRHVQAQKLRWSLLAER